MSKKMTNEEAIALYNEIESKKTKTQQIMVEKTTKLYGYVSDVNLCKTYPNVSFEIIQWIFDKKQFATISPNYQKEALQFIYSDQYSNPNHRSIDVVCEFLTATQDPKLIEVANKMKMLNKYIPINSEEKIEMALIILRQAPSKELINVEGYAYSNNSNYTIQHEIKQIKKRFKKAKKQHQKNLNKYNNIYNINEHKLYDAIMTFLRNHGSWPYGVHTGDEINEHLIKNLEDTVYANQQDAIDMLYEQDCLKFITKKKLGKIK